MKRITAEITALSPENEGILKVYDVSDADMYLYYEITEERLLIAQE